MNDTILDAPLLRLTPQDDFTVRDLVQNVSILGQPGSGKTTGSGAHLAKAILRMGAGVLVMCAKADERALWERYCAETGRSDSLIIFDGKQHRYNFIAAELARHGLRAIGTIVECIMQVLLIARSLSGATGKADVFWEDIVRLLLRHSLPVIYLATGTISIAHIIAFIRSVPRTREEMSDPAWQRESFFYQCFADARERIEPALAVQLLSFWRDEWISLDSKTKSNASISLCTVLDRFNHGFLRDAFTTDSTLTLELLMNCAVIVLDMPAVTHLEDGILGQRLTLFCAERLLLGRQSYGKADAERPVALWIDEAPVFVDEHLSKFMGLSRSVRCGTVLMAQSLGSYYATIGGENARDRVDQLLGNCATKIWHSQSCPITNKVASDTLGQTLQRRANFSHGSGSSANGGASTGLGENWGSNSSSGSSSGSSWSAQGGGSSNSGWNSSHGSSEGSNANRGRSSGWGTSENISEGWSEQMAPIMEPADFGRLLRTGGPQNGNCVDGVWYQAGRTFAASRGPALFLEFRQ